MAFKLVFSSVLANLEKVLENYIPKYAYLPAIHSNLTQLQANQQPKDFNLKDLLSGGFMWYCPTPKHRTSAEKKLTKRFTRLPNNWITKYSTPKRNIISCLECGTFHEIGTICGKCYESVKEQTLKIQQEMAKKSSN